MNCSNLVQEGRSFPGGTVVKNPPAKQEIQETVPGSGRPLEKGMATHSSVLPGKSHGQRSLVNYSL